MSPIYVIATNPLSRFRSNYANKFHQGKQIGITEAIKELVNDKKQFGIKGMFRGQGTGLAKAIISLTLFHEGRLFLTNQMKIYNDVQIKIYKYNNNI